MIDASYSDVEYVLAEIITEATGEPRVGRLERSLAESALRRLREMGLMLSTPPADDVRSVCDQCGNSFDEHYCAPIPSCIHLPAAESDREALIAVFERTPGDEPAPEDEHESAPGAYHRMWEEHMADAVLNAGFARRHDASTPTADDVREALAATVKRISQRFGGPSLAEFANDPPTRKHYATADAILAEFVVNEVPGGCVYCSSSGVIEDYEGDRPCSACCGTGTPKSRGTVTDARVELACRAFYEDASGMTQWGRLVEVEPEMADRYRSGMRAALKAAREVRP